MKILQKWNFWSSNATKSFNVKCYTNVMQISFEKKKTVILKSIERSDKQEMRKFLQEKLLILRGTIKFSLQLEYGEDMWLQLLERADCKHMVFNTRQTYPDELMTNLAAALAEFNGESVENVMQFFGKCFVRFFSNLG